MWVGVAELRWRGVRVRWIVRVIIASSATRGYLWTVYMSIRIGSRGWFSSVGLSSGVIAICRLWIIHVWLWILHVVWNVSKYCTFECERIFRRLLQFGFSRVE